LAVIYASRKKTDKIDAVKPAQVLEDTAEQRLPVVPLPGEGELKRRKLLAGYRREQGERNRALNRPRGLFVARRITMVVEKDLATGESREATIQMLDVLEGEEAEHLEVCLELYEGRFAALDGQMAEEGDEALGRLQTVPGVGPKVAADLRSDAFAAQVAAERFENAAQVSNYLGLYISGKTVRYGKITKRWNGYIRALLVQGAWAVTRSKQGGARGSSMNI
jgi:transposase